MFGFLRHRATPPKSSPKRISKYKPSRRLGHFERLEDRSVLSTFSVLNLSDSGSGSFRQAILDSNSTVGADIIDFAVDGIITLTSGALPTITDRVDIDGRTAPNYLGQPQVEVNYNRFAGISFAAGSAGSHLRALSLVNSGGNGVTVNNVGSMQIVGNWIGVGLNQQAFGNTVHGVSLINSSDNVIGGTEIVNGYLVVDRNLISANGGHGVSMNGAYRNTIVGNYIGVDISGTVDMGNGGSGVRLHAGADNMIGGPIANVISANKADGVVLSGGSHHNTVGGNLIGTSWNGAAAVGNRLMGVRLDGANFNVVGDSDPVSSITYYDGTVSGWQGITAADDPGQFYITGTQGSDGVLYQGPIDGSGTYTTMSYPTSTLDTTTYSAYNLGSNNVRLVGTYKNSDYATAPVEVNGFIYTGGNTSSDLGDASNYITLNVPNAKFNYAHSTSGSLVVGNYDNPADYGDYGLPYGAGHSFIYDVDSAAFLPDIVYPGSTSNTAYGVWYNGGTSYTIVGGYSTVGANNFADPERPIGTAYMVDFDSATQEFTHWASFTYPKGQNYVSHFEGISSVETGVYTLAAVTAQSGADTYPLQGSFVTVRRNADDSFGDAVWVDLHYPGVDPTLNTTAGDSVYGNNVVGVVIGPDFRTYQATVNADFVLSNVISGSGINGVALYSSSDNVVAQNYIGTDSTGTVDLGNGLNGVLISNASARNMVGGEATGGNNPTQPVFVRPPLGNLISGNNANGVLINNEATDNQLSGNFIGTDAAGTAALGNSLDGVAISGADGNSLLGCTFQQDPFVFYNVISGNLGNGLRVTDADDTTIQANIFGLNATNDGRLGNAKNGVLVEGSSTRTTLGGPIPLGNVVSANGANGVEVRNTASYFVGYNTFCGIAAFDNLPLYGNTLDGFLITSIGGNNLLRTNVISRNGDDGIDVSLGARDVRLVGNIVGLNTDGVIPLGNEDNGIEVGGNAQDIVIGGPQDTFNVIPQNAISANHGHGVAIIGTAHNITISHSYIGTDIFGLGERGNSGDGVYVGAGTYLNTIGSPDQELLTVISGNHGNGIELRGTQANTVLGVYIGTNAHNDSPVFNHGNGILIAGNSKNNVIGGAMPNVIAYNGLKGVFVESGSGNSILNNSIYLNTYVGIDLAPGANMNQPAPVLNTVTAVAGGIQVTGVLTGKANVNYVLQLFANDLAEAGGRYLLGSMTVRTNRFGTASFTFTGPALPVGASYVTATATDPSGNTSEFSNAIS